MRKPKQSAADAFRQNIRRILAERGQTQGAFCLDNEMSQEYLSKMLHGKAGPSLEYCERVAAAFDVPLSSLLTSQATKADSKNSKKILKTGIAKFGR